MILLLTLFLILVYWPHPSLEPDVIPSTISQEEAFFKQIIANQNLDRSFPPVKTRPDNPFTKEKVELGRLLYFDPILSGKNDISCAHCHHPDLGFSDNRALSMGIGGLGVGRERKNGRILARSSPTIWNTTYNHLQYWDGRSIDLEDQAKNPIQHPDEMGQDPDQLVEELQSIPEYVRQFAANFNDGVTFQNVTYAIASFERSLVTHESPFDKFAKGDSSALTPSAQRGLNIFRSMKTRCFECHNFPTFANPDFKVIGVPDSHLETPDLGRGGITGNSNDNFAFKVPSLRNIALTAPYMHNGSLDTLSDVIDFYAKGGGSSKGLSNIDDKIRPFTLAKQEKVDLIAFLHSLTDESNKPSIPSVLPSGLPPVSRLENQSVELQRASRLISKTLSSVSKHGSIITIQSGQKIQDGINLAVAGDTIRIMPGLYHETLSVDISGVVIEGVLEEGSRPILDGLGKLADGIIGSGSNITLRNLTIRNYTANGVMINRAHNITFEKLYCHDTGLYGVYPVECVGIHVDSCEVTGVRDAGIYVGQSKDIVVEDCRVYSNVTGIEIENSVNAIVQRNIAYDNAGGILVFLLPNNPSKFSRNCRVINNQVFDNNHVNFADPNAAVSGVPSGSGIMIMAADEVEVAYNQITGNNSYGVGLIALSNQPKGKKLDVDPIASGCWIHDNILENNGKHPDSKLLELGLPGADLLWDVTGYDNSWQQPGATSMPWILPGKSWPEILRRANWRLWKTLSN